MPVARPGAARLQPPVARRRPPRRRVRAAVRPVHGLPADLRDCRCLHPLLRLMHAIPVSAGNRRDVVDVDRAGAAGTRGRPRRLHLRGGRDQPHRQPAAVQARLRADRRGPRRAGDPGVPRSRLGQHLQLQAGTFFWKWPERLPYPGDRRVRRADAVVERPRPTCGMRVMLLGSDAMIAPASPGTRCCTSGSSATAKRHWGQLAMADATRDADLRARARRRACCSRAGSAAHGGTPAHGRPAAAGLGRRRAGQHRGADRGGRVPVNLNFTAGREAIASAIEQCEIDTILTSRQFLAKAKLDRCSRAWCSSRTSCRPSARPPSCVTLRRRAPVAGAGCSIACYAPEPDDADAARDGDLLERQHRRAEGRDAVAPQRAVERRRDGAGLPGSRRRTASSACCRSSTPSASRARCGSRCWAASRRCTSPTRWTRRRSASWRAPTARRCSSARRRSASRTCAAARRSSSRSCATRSSAPRSCASRSRRAFQEKFGVELLEGYGCTEMAPVVSGEHAVRARRGRWARSSARSATRCPAWSCSVVDPETGAPRARRRDRACCSSRART